MEEKKTKLFPAIDMRGGMVVRLKQGDYNKMTAYGAGPVDMAYIFDECGAECLHLVDLDGAQTGVSHAVDTIKAIKKGTSMMIEIGGGIRTQDKIEEFLLAGADRVILGTVAMTDRVFTKRMIDTYGPGIAIGIDIKNGMAAIKGWTELSSMDGDTALKTICDMGAETIICTDVSRDGAMEGIDEGFYKGLVEKYTGEYGCGIIASGGVTTLNDIRRLSHIGLEGIIVGRALYDDAFTLEDALKAME